MLAVALLISLAVQDTAAVRARADSLAQVRASQALRRAAAADSTEARRARQAQAVMGDAYADDAAREMVTRARSARQRNERLVTDYTVNVTQRIGVGLRALRRDRMLYGQELAARIEWHRDGPSRVVVSGARERIPIATRGDRIPEDLDDDFEWLVLDPSADYLRIAGSDAEGFVHPLRQNSEAEYRFSSGDTTTITLPDGRTVRLLELAVRARRADFNLINGSLWFDADSYGLVRAVFAPARPFDIELDADSGDADDIPGFVKPIRAEVRYVTLEYGLYDFHWWMLRFLALDAEAQASVVHIPMRFERVYEGYQVQGGSEPLPGARRPAGSIRPQEQEGQVDSLTRAERDSLRRQMVRCMEQKADSARKTLEGEHGRQGANIEVSTSGGRYRSMCRRDLGRAENDRWPIEMVIPDTNALLTSPALGAPILQMGDVISENELRELGHDINAIPARQWQYHAHLPDGVGAVLKTARYNRVEALSLGLQGEIDWGRLKADGLVRIGIADGEPNFEMGLTRPMRSSSFRLGGYRRLDAANLDARPFSSMNSFNALFRQIDDGQYFRSFGGELTGMQSPGGWWKVRLFGEHQWAANVETQASLPHLFNSDNNFFNPNIAASSADQFGGALTLRGSTTLGRDVTLGADATADGAGGTFEFGRGQAATRLTVGGLGHFSVGVEGAAGSSTGNLPAQSAFYLGGPFTLRGYDGGVIAGDAFWRGRGELGWGIPAVRAVLFTDLGWAGNRADFTRGRPLIGAGIGVSFLDGILRMDLGRATRPPTQWRVDFYLDAIL